MAMTNPELWTRIKPHKFMQDEDVFLPGRLKSEFRWNKVKSNAALREFRKFIYLCAISKLPLVPSAEIYALWREMVFLIPDEWDGVCLDMSGHTLRHLSLPDTRERWDRYETTRNLYEREFGHPAPSEHWSLVTPRTVRNVRLLLATGLIGGVILLVLPWFVPGVNAVICQTTGGILIAAFYIYLNLDDTWHRVRGLGYHGIGCGSGAAAVDFPDTMPAEHSDLHA